MTWVVTGTAARAVTNMSSEIAHIESPCVNICSLDADGYCIGCRRSVKEIATWSTMTSQERRDVIELLHERDADCASG